MAATKGQLMSARGMTPAEYIVRYISKLGSDVTGIALHGRTYPGGKVDTSTVIDGLAEPKHGPKRDIRPVESDVYEAAKVFTKEIVRRLTRSKAKVKKKTAIETMAQAKANAAAAGGLRKGGKLIRNAMMERVDDQTLNTGAAAPPCTNKEYIRWRRKKYGVGERVVFKRSGLLLTHLAYGALRLTRKGSLATDIGGKLGI